MLLTLVTKERWKTQMMSIQKRRKQRLGDECFSREGLYWSRTPPNVARARSENIILRLTGCVDEPKNANTPQNAFSLFISDDILNIMLLHTNKKIHDFL
jgi:hypothetical protein